MEVNKDNIIIFFIQVTRVVEEVVTECLEAIQVEEWAGTAEALAVKTKRLTDIKTFNSSSSVFIRTL